MQYLVRNLATPTSVGSYSVEEIEAMLKSGELSADALARADTGESPAHAAAWLCVHQLPGVGGNPLMRGLSAPQLPTNPNPTQKLTDDVSDGNSCCRQCSARVVSGETLCRNCAEHTARGERKSAAPHRLIVFFIQVPGGLLAHFVSFIVVCALCAMLGGSYTTHKEILVLVAIVHGLAWTALAFFLIRNPTGQGFGFGIFIGVCVTGLLTGSCALK